MDVRPHPVPGAGAAEDASWVHRCCGHGHLQPHHVHLAICNPGDHQALFGVLHDLSLSRISALGTICWRLVFLEKARTCIQVTTISLENTQTVGLSSCNIFLALPHAKPAMLVKATVLFPYPDPPSTASNGNVQTQSAWSCLAQNASHHHSIQRLVRASSQPKLAFHFCGCGCAGGREPDSELHGGLGPACDRSGGAVPRDLSAGADL